MKKNILNALLVVLFVSPTFASNSPYGDLDPDVNVSEIPVDTLVKLNSDISLSRFVKSNKSEGGKVFQNFDDRGFSVGSSQKYCAVRVMFDDKEEFKFAGARGPVVIPSGTLLKVTKATLGFGGYDELKLNFVEPIHTTFATIDTMFIDCAGGMRAWWNNEDININLSNMIRNMGDRISILNKEESKTLAQNAPREPMEGGSTNPVTQHEATASGEEKPLSEIIFKKKKPTTTITVVPGKRTQQKTTVEPAPSNATPATTPETKPDDTKK